MSQKRKRQPKAEVEPNQILREIYALNTRGKHTRSHIVEELRQIKAAAQAKLDDYHQAKQNRRRHGRRTAKDIAARAAWFAANRKEVRDEPRKAAIDPVAESEHEWSSLAEYEAWIASTVAPQPAQPGRMLGQR